MAKKNENVDIFENVEVEDDKKENKDDVLTKALQEENEKLISENNELNTKYLSALAEQKNYKKRIDDEMDRFVKYARFDFCRELLPVLDSLELATAKEVSGDETKAYLDGIKITKNQLISLLEKEGVKEIDALGKEFDPNTMLAVSTVNDNSKKDQEVVNVFMKGYMYKDRVLRAANVIVNQKEE